MLVEYATIIFEHILQNLNQMMVNLLFRDCLIDSWVKEAIFSREPFSSSGAAHQPDQRYNVQVTIFLVMNEEKLVSLFSVWWYGTAVSLIDLEPVCSGITICYSGVTKGTSLSRDISLNADPQIWIQSIERFLQNHFHELVVFSADWKTAFWGPYEVSL